MSTDDEQIEALQNWWKENGVSSLIGVALVFIAFFGWRQWDTSSDNHEADASDLYQQIVDLIAIDPGFVVTDEDISTVNYLNEQLRSDYDDTIYARYSALFMAKLLVDDNDLTGAEAQLSWVIDNPGLGLMQSSDNGLLLTARGRLARVVIAQGDAQRALDLLQAVESDEFVASFAEIEGDAYRALGQSDAAISAYQRALDSGEAGPLVELKLTDLAGLDTTELDI